MTECRCSELLVRNSQPYAGRYTAGVSRESDIQTSNLLAGGGSVVASGELPILVPHSPKPPTLINTNRQSLPEGHDAMALTSVIDWVRPYHRDRCILEANGA